MLISPHFFQDYPNNSCFTDSGTVSTPFIDQEKQPIQTTPALHQAPTATQAAHFADKMDPLLNQLAELNNHIKRAEFQVSDYSVSSLSHPVGPAISQQPAFNFP
mmetsp:Transcript_37519/g.57478  ORF Transcript_37519/g.57478 Transcript_37519/m.57478 type:complete len:104 (-) Transcript_37519:945-1256(-)